MAKISLNCFAPFSYRSQVRIWWGGLDSRMTFKAWTNMNRGHSIQTQTRTEIPPRYLYSLLGCNSLEHINTVSCCSYEQDKKVIFLVVQARRDQAAFFFFFLNFITNWSVTQRLNCNKWQRKVAKGFNWNKIWQKAHRHVAPSKGRLQEGNNETRRISGPELWNNSKRAELDCVFLTHSVIEI